MNGFFEKRGGGGGRCGSGRGRGRGVVWCEVECEVGCGTLGGCGDGVTGAWIEGDGI